MSNLISKQQVKVKAGVQAERTVDRWVAAGILPRPIKINGRCKWYEHVIDRAIDRIATSQTGDAR
jgi:predicted DNA-binding transcriptional regulator AlpA